MFLLHRCLGGVDGFADAAQLGEEERRRVNLRSCTASPPTQPFIVGLTINVRTNKGIMRS